MNYHRILIQSGADINKKDKGNNSALHGASINGHLEMVKLLLEAGANKEQLIFQIPPCLSLSFSSN